MEPLMRLVVPGLDGGLFKPIFETVADNIGNFTEPSGFEFRLDATWAAGNETDDTPVAMNATYGLNASRVDIGKPLLQWYFTRLRSQVPLFCVSTALWLALLGCLLIAWLRMRGTSGQRGSGNRNGHTLNSARSQKSLKRLFALMIVIVLLIVIGSVLFAMHWFGRSQFSGMFNQDGNDTFSANDDANSKSRLTAMFRHTIDEFDRFVELSIVETNATVLTVCKEELPNVLRVLETVATYLLDKLAGDFKLAPLLDSFDEFIDLIKLLVDSMRAVKESRQGVVSPLAEFTTLIDSHRRDLQKLVSDACLDTRSWSPPADLCNRINGGLDRLDVGVNYRQLDSDSSVTIVTLLEKMLKLNFSQVEAEVGNAKGQLYGSLDLVKAEVRKLFKQLAVAVSTQFENALVDARFFRSNLRGAKRDRGFLEAMATIDRLVLGMSVSMAIGSFVFLAILCLAMFVSIRYMLSFRNASTSRNGGGGTGEDSVDGVPLTYIGRAGLTPESWMPTKRRKSLSSPSQSSREPRDWHSNSLMASCLLVLAALVYASVVFYAGSETQMDICRYATTHHGLEKLDQFVDNIVREKLWPQIETLLDREAKIPLGITKDKIPKRLLGPLMDRCGNVSVTVFQALDLVNLVNVSEILRTPTVLGELAKGSVMIQDMVRGLNTSNLIPPEVDDLLQKTLPSFAAVIDSENFGPSIRELRQPLLSIGPRWPGLLSDVSQLEAGLQHANASDRRPVLIRYFVDQTASLIDQRSPALKTKLDALLGHYETLQTNRHLTNLTVVLTANAIALKVALSDKQLLLGSIRRRYNETLEKHMTTVATLMTGILDRLLARVGRCRPLWDVFQTPIGWCRTQIQPLPTTGFYMMASCVAFYILVHLLLLLMHCIRTGAG